MPLDHQGKALRTDSRVAGRVTGLEHMEPYHQDSEFVGDRVTSLHSGYRHQQNCDSNDQRINTSRKNKPLLWLLLHSDQSSSAGFTLLESMVVVAIIGILAAIAASSWLSFLNTWRLNAAQDQVYQIMVMTRSTAKQEQRRWQASFRNDSNQVEWAVHPVSKTIDMDSLPWQTLPGQVQIDDYESTLYRSSEAIYRVQFDHDGNTNGRLGRLTLEGITPHKTRRCVFVSTLIGTLRKASDRPKPRNNRYCY